MFTDWLLASFHHLAVFSLAGILAAEIALTAGGLEDRAALRLARVDAWFGIAAAIALAAGVARVFLGAKGAAYYGANMFFWLKMLLFAGIALLSVVPTFSYLDWRRRFRADPVFARPPRRSRSCARCSTARPRCSPPSPSAPPRWRAAMACGGCDRVKERAEITAAIAVT